MIEGSGSDSGSGSVPLTNGSGSGMRKNIRIRMRTLQARIGRYPPVFVLECFLMLTDVVKTKDKREHLKRTSQQLIEKRTSPTRWVAALSWHLVCSGISGTPGIRLRIPDPVQDPDNFFLGSKTGSPGRTSSSSNHEIMGNFCGSFFKQSLFTLHSPFYRNRTCYETFGAGMCPVRYVILDMIAGTVLMGPGS